MKTKFHWMLCLALLLSLLFTPTPAIAQACDPAFVTQAGHVITVKVTSIDDTANLQCAFELAVAAGPGQTVRLLRGTYHTGQIVVNGFHGTFTGTGTKNTVVTNLPDLYVTPVDSNVNPPSADNPWPSLFTFVEGDITISSLAIQIEGDHGTTGWSIFGISPPIIELAAAIIIIGDQANAVVDHFLLEGEPMENSVFGYNMINGIFFEGWFPSVESPTPPISGSFTVIDSTFRSAGAATPVESLSGASVLITRNNYEDVYSAVESIDVLNSNIVFSHNKVNGAHLGFAFYPFTYPETNNVNFLVMNNIIQASVGISIDPAPGTGNTCLIKGNNVQHSTDLGIYLGPGTKGCVVVGNGNKANVVDEGTGNIITGVDHIRHGVGPFIHFFKRFKR
jgi:hypothetical protein